MADLVLDAGVLIALEAQDRDAKAWFEEAGRRQTTLLVAGATFAEVWRGGGGKNWQLGEILKAVEAIPTTEAVGRRAGELIAGTGQGGEVTLDAIVVATAQHYRADVLSSDPDDFEPLTVEAGVRLFRLNPGP